MGESSLSRVWFTFMPALYRLRERIQSAGHVEIDVKVVALLIFFGATVLMVLGTLLFLRELRLI